MAGGLCSPAVQGARAEVWRSFPPRLPLDPQSPFCPEGCFASPVWHRPPGPPGLPGSAAAGRGGHPEGHVPLVGAAGTVLFLRLPPAPAARVKLPAQSPDQTREQPRGRRDPVPANHKLDAPWSPTVPSGSLLTSSAALQPLQVDREGAQPSSEAADRRGNRGSELRPDPRGNAACLGVTGQRSVCPHICACARVCTCMCVHVHAPEKVVGVERGRTFLSCTDVSFSPLLSLKPSHASWGEEEKQEAAWERTWARGAAGAAVGRAQLCFTRNADLRPQPPGPSRARRPGRVRPSPSQADRSPNRTARPDPFPTNARGAQRGAEERTRESAAPGTVRSCRSGRASRASGTAGERAAAERASPQTEAPPRRLPALRVGSAVTTRGRQETSARRRRGSPPPRSAPVGRTSAGQKAGPRARRTAVCGWDHGQPPPSAASRLPAVTRPRRARAARWHGHPGERRGHAPRTRDRGRRAARAGSSPRPSAPGGVPRSHARRGRDAEPWPAAWPKPLPWPSGPAFPAVGPEGRPLSPESGLFLTDFFLLFFQG